MPNDLPIQPEPVATSSFNVADLATLPSRLDRIEKRLEKWLLAEVMEPAFTTKTQLHNSGDGAPLVHYPTNRLMPHRQQPHHATPAVRYAVSPCRRQDHGVVVGTSDLVLFPSGVKICGLNIVSRSVLSNAGAENLGYADLVEVVSFGEGKMVKITGIKDRSLQDALYVVRYLVNKRFLVGGRAPEIELSRQLGAVQRPIAVNNSGTFSAHRWTIKTMQTEKPPPMRDKYVPVIISQKTVSHIASVDMMPGGEDRENIGRARASGKAVLSGPFRLLNSHHLGVALTFPIYEFMLLENPTVGERVDATAGFLGDAFDVESLVEKLLGQLAGNQAIDVNVYDVTNPSAPLRMYGYHDEKGGMPLLHGSKLELGDPFREHVMICKYDEKGQTNLTVLTTAFLLSLIGLLVGHILYGAATHIVKIEDDFQVMEELKFQAEAARVAKSQSLATVSREIRKPMKGILGMFALLLDTDLSSTQRDYAPTAQACGKALITLITEVLDRAKIEARKLEIEVAPFDLRLILGDILSLFSEKSRNKHAALALLNLPHDFDACFMGIQMPEFNLEVEVVSNGGSIDKELKSRKPEQRVQEQRTLKRRQQDPYQPYPRELGKMQAALSETVGNAASIANSYSNAIGPHDSYKY